MGDPGVLGGRVGGVHGGPARERREGGRGGREGERVGSGATDPREAGLREPYPGEEGRDPASLGHKGTQAGEIGGLTG